MATVPSSAKVVVIGAGIVGNSLVHHLARLGWRDIVQVDKGPLPNPGGSTGHAFNSRFNSLRKRQSVPSATSLLGLVLIIPTSRRRRA